MKNYTGIGCYYKSIKVMKVCTALDPPDDAYEHIGGELFGRLAILSAQNSIMELKRIKKRNLEENSNG